MEKDKMLKETKKSVEERINEINESGLNENNLEHLYKLIDIYKDVKEVESMNYGNYGNYGNYSGRGPSRGSYGEYGRGGYGNYGEYGEYGNYGRRGYDAKYRGDEELDRMAGEYGRYMENRSRYGAGEETDKSFHYMTKALEDFIKVLGEEAETPQQKQQLMQTLQNSMR